LWYCWPLLLLRRLRLLPRLDRLLFLKLGF
jgi:hypothetical protein